MNILSFSKPTLQDNKTKSYFNLILCVLASLDTCIRAKHIVSQSHVLNMFASVNDFDLKCPKIRKLLFCEVRLHLLLENLKHDYMNTLIP